MKFPWAQVHFFLQKDEISRMRGARTTSELCRSENSGAAWPVPSPPGLPGCSELVLAVVRNTVGRSSPPVVSLAFFFGVSENSMGDESAPTPFLDGIPPRKGPRDSSAVRSGHPAGLLESFCLAENAFRNPIRSHDQSVFERAVCKFRTSRRAGDLNIPSFSNTV
ncbi:hypothetical protein Sfum_2636 [Syntrophobacter fumaroxidans MPOB]|uniref:Uncharacterized protein n=1 Tax=Syntrophobacter fumaroxidans (strain DSM 10017 / MPOB) TaxID=335543 RepID=A0LLL2_SYNFM|nr:hypothetical protein Sfum_2636 [Syntrophobacter fumaroxidans MPOB]